MSEFDDTLDSSVDGIATNFAAGPNSGAQIGEYTIERRIGVGGMGEVFKVRRGPSGPIVALKLLSGTSALRLYRFKREFRSLANVEHPNLVRLYELSVPESGPAFFTMELIDGLPFVDWVRGAKPVGQLPDLDRLLAALRQLVEGVHHLHTHGYVHRDLKPANVLVDKAGRVVILDFGLVADAEDGGITQDQRILGTPNFMAPEQAYAAREPSVDVYAMGVMLYQCMTGRLPHRGLSLEQLLDKRSLDTPDPADVVTDSPKWLRSLCVRLLAREPSARPSTRELLARLHSQTGTTLQPPKLFIGRARELAELHAAHKRVQHGGAPVIVTLHGPSGYGKSTLCEQFRGQIQGPVTILHGRCLHNETVPYKGIDAIVDHLSATLRRLPSTEIAGLRPSAPESLVRMFPVLDELWPVAGSEHQPALDETRRLGVTSLRGLLKALSEHQQLLLHIDDFQWADPDSVQLLETLLRPPDAPALLLLLSYRSDTLAQVLEHLGSLDGVAETHHIELRGLSHAEAHDLACELVRLSGGDPLSAGVATIAFRARGNPLFISQTVLGGRVDADDPDVDDLVAHRLQALDDRGRALLELVAVFGAPMSFELALELAPSADASTIRTLCEQGLLVEDAAGIDTAHDRVREVALEMLSETTQAQIHAAIGARLRASIDEHTGGERLFAAVNHLDAGYLDIDAMSPELRLDLARLNHRAGQLALQSTAWTAAYRYYEFARRLLKPWLPEARAGRGELRLCTDTMFGWCQVAFFLEHRDAVSAVDELLGWSLSAPDHSRVAKWYCEVNFLKARFAEGASHGTLALRRIGVAVPQRPSWPAAVWLFMRGWRTIDRTGLEHIVALPQIEDEQVEAALDIAALTTACAGFSSIKQQLASMGSYCSLLARHGLHEWAGVAVCGLAMSAAAIGNDERAREYLRATLHVVATRQSSAWAVSMCHTMLLVVLPTLVPLDEARSLAEHAYARAREVGQRMLQENVGVMLVFNSFLFGEQINKQVEFMGDIRRTCREFTFAHMREQFDDLELSLAVLLEGGARFEPDRAFGTSLNEGQRGFLQVIRLLVAVLAGERDGSRWLAEQQSRAFPRELGLLWPAAMSATLIVVVFADEPSAELGARWRRARAMRRHRKTVLRWARRCPSNFQPMLDLVDAEIARTSLDVGPAIEAYERARAGARANLMLWLDGLASERMASLLTLRGNNILADASLQEARRAYDQLGATAVVQRIIDLRSEQR